MINYDEYPKRKTGDFKKSYIKYLKENNPDLYIKYLKDKEESLTNSEKLYLQKLSEKKKDGSKTETIYDSNNNCLTIIPYNDENPGFNLFKLFATTKYNDEWLFNNLRLYKQFGKQTSKSVIYNTLALEKNRKYPSNLLIKITLQNKEKNNEIELFKELSANAIKKNIHHIPVYYDHFICDKIIRHPSYPELLSKAPYKYNYYSLLLYEFAEGDLISFINEYDINDENVLKNMYEQLYMSIFTLHYMGYIHNNTIGCNFIYRTVKKGGCFHYKINGKDYYIQNLGIKWMIWNYENCEKLDEKVKYIFLQDYYQLNIELSHRNLAFEKTEEYKSNEYNPLNVNIIADKKVSGKLSDDIKLPNAIINLQEKLWELFLLNTPKSILRACAKGDIKSADFIKLLCDNKLLYSNTQIGKIVSSTLF